MEAAGNNPLDYQPLREDALHLRIVAEKFQQVRADLLRSVTGERARCRELELRLQQAKEAEKAAVQALQRIVVTAKDYALLDRIAIKLRDENKKCKDEIQELRNRASVEADVAEARVAAWERSSKEAQRALELERQATRDAAREARDAADRDRKAAQDAFQEREEETRRRHEEALSTLRAELAAVREECAEEVNLSALEFEDRAAQLGERIATLEADKLGLDEQLSATQGHVEYLQSRLVELQRTHAEHQRVHASLETENARLLESNRGLEAENARLLESNRGLVLQQQGLLQAAQRSAHPALQPLQPPRPRTAVALTRFRAASAAYSAPPPPQSGAYPQLPMAWRRATADQEQRPEESAQMPVQPAPGPPPSPPPKPAPRRRSRKAFEAVETVCPARPEDSVARAASWCRPSRGTGSTFRSTATSQPRAAVTGAPSSRFTFKRRIFTYRPPAPATERPPTQTTAAAYLSTDTPAAADVRRETPSGADEDRETPDAADIPRDTSSAPNLLRESLAATDMPMEAPAPTLRETPASLSVEKPLLVEPPPPTSTPASSLPAIAAECATRSVATLAAAAEVEKDRTDPPEENPASGPVAAKARLKGSRRLFSSSSAPETFLQFLSKLPPTKMHFTIPAKPDPPPSQQPLPPLKQQEATVSLQSTRQFFEKQVLDQAPPSIDAAASAAKDIEQTELVEAPAIEPVLQMQERGKQDKVPVTEPVPQIQDDGQQVQVPLPEPVSQLQDETQQDTMTVSEPVSEIQDQGLDELPAASLPAAAPRSPHDPQLREDVIAAACEEEPHEPAPPSEGAQAPLGLQEVVERVASNDSDALTQLVEPSQPSQSESQALEEASRLADMSIYSDLSLSTVCSTMCSTLPLADSQLLQPHAPGDARVQSVPLGPPAICDTFDHGVAFDEERSSGGRQVEEDAVVQLTSPPPPSQQPADGDTEDAVKDVENVPEPPSPAPDQAPVSWTTCPPQPALEDAVPFPEEAVEDQSLPTPTPEPSDVQLCPSLTCSPPGSQELSLPPADAGRQNLQPLLASPVCCSPPVQPRVEKDGLGVAAGDTAAPPRREDQAEAEDKDKASAEHADEAPSEDFIDTISFSPLVSTPDDPSPGRLVIDWTSEPPRPHEDVVTLDVGAEDARGPAAGCASTGLLFLQECYEIGCSQQSKDNSAGRTPGRDPGPATSAQAGTSDKAVLKRSAHLPGGPSQTPPAATVAHTTPKAGPRQKKRRRLVWAEPEAEPAVEPVELES